MNGLACRAALLGLWLAVLIATAPMPQQSPSGVVHVPCHPVAISGGAECTGTADIPPGTRLVIYEPATESEAAMVRRQILDARRMP